jgi:signal peptidase I
MTPVQGLVKSDCQNVLPTTTQGQAELQTVRPETTETPEAFSGERNTISDWTVTILLLVFGTTTLVQAFVIPTPSMEGTLLVGDHLLVDKLAYAPAGPLTKYLLPYSEVKRGDIIVFRWPTDISFTYVKRVVGIPGDRIRIENRQLLRNGVRISEPYKVHKSDFFDSYRDHFPSEPNTALEAGGRTMLRDHVRDGEVVVPPNAYFALGDNRDESSDSRYWGFVPRENIFGKPLVVYWSFAPSTPPNAPPAPMTEQIKDLAGNLFARTRWQRSFRLIHGYSSKD